MECFSQWSRAKDLLLETDAKWTQWMNVCAACVAVPIGLSKTIPSFSLGNRCRGQFGAPWQSNRADLDILATEALSLTSHNLLAVPHRVLLVFPQENVAQSKVGRASDTVAVDSGRLRWMERAVNMMISGTPTSLSSRQTINLFSTSCEEQQATLGSKQCFTRWSIQARLWTWRATCGLSQDCQKRRWASLNSLKKVSSWSLFPNCWGPQSCLKEQ